MNVRNSPSYDVSKPAQSGCRLAYDEQKLWRFWYYDVSPFMHAVEGILNQFRTQFIADIDPDAIVLELLEKDIIPDGVKENMRKSDSPTQKNQILLEHLKRQCTEEALIVACDIFIGVTGYPKMAALGKFIKKELETRKCACMCVLALMHIHVLMCVTGCTPHGATSLLRYSSTDSKLSLGYITSDRVTIKLFNQQS